MSLLLALLAAFAPIQERERLPLGGAPTQARPADGAGSRARLVAIEAELGETLAARHAPRARNLGLPPGDRPRAQDSAWWNRYLQRVENELESLWTPELGAFDRARRDALLALVDGESILGSGLPRRRWDPVFHVERAEHLVEAAAKAAPDERAELLAALSAGWVQAREALVSPRTGWISEASLRVTALRVRLARMQQEEAVVQAARECEEFLAWLVEANTLYGQPMPRLGRRNWEALIQAVTGTSLDTRALRVELLREIARLDTELGPYAPPHVPDLTRDEVLAKAGQHALGARNGATVAEIVPGLKHEVTLQARAGGAYPLPQLRVLHDVGRSTLLVTEPDESWPEPLREAYDRDIHHWVLGAAAIRHGIPGEGTLYGLARRDGDTHPMCWNRSVVEGWGLYALDWLSRHPETAERFERFAPQKPEMIRQRLIETARLLATLEWHALDHGEGLVAKGLAERTGLDPAVTQLEARRATHDPLFGVGALGAMELAALEELVARQLAPPDPIRFVLDLVLSRPALRPRDLVNHGLAGEPRQRGS